MLTTGGECRAADAPDWSQVTRDVTCPLCRYNLRGLADPRCPECGHTFLWPDLLDPSRQLHPYLFEHHPERNVQSFIRTTIGNLNPWKFWRALRPEQPLRAPRMILYWCITVALASGVLTIPYVSSMLGEWQLVSWQRRNAPKPPFIDVNTARPVLVTAATYQSWLDKNYPLPPHLSFFTTWWQKGAVYPRLSWHVKIPLLALFVWPWLTFLTLLMFWQTMGMARVNRLHLLRSVIYSFDIGVWLTVAALIRGCLEIWEHRPSQLFGWWGFASAGAEVVRMLPLATGVLLTFACLRLRVSMARYFNFPHPTAVVVSSQIIAVLTIGVLLVTVTPLLEFVVRYFWL